MKKALSFILALALLIFSSAPALAIHFARPTPEPEPEVDQLVGSVICDYNNLTITVTDAEIVEYALSDRRDLKIYVNIENKNDFEYEGYIDAVVVNGWQMERTCWFGIKGGNKMKSEITVLDVDGIDVFALEDMETFAISFHLVRGVKGEITDTVELKLK